MNLQAIENSFVCTPTRRIVAAMFLAALLAALMNWFLTGPFTSSLVARLSDPLIIHDAEIITPVVKPGSDVVIKLISTKMQDCGGQASSWLLSQSFRVIPIAPTVLGAQQANQQIRTTLLIPVSVPLTVNPGRYRLVRVLDYDCPGKSYRVRFPSTLFFEVR